MLDPNGSAPLTAILSKCKNERVRDPHFHWFTKVLSAQRAAVTGVWTDDTLAAAYAGSGAAGLTLYIQMAEANVDKFRPRHQMLLRLSTSLTTDINAKVIATTKAGASSYIEVTLLEADGGTDLQGPADVAMVVGNLNPEGASAPDAQVWDSSEWANYTQIFRDSVSHTGTQLETKLRTGDNEVSAKRDAMRYHSIGMEKAYLFGKKTMGQGYNGKPERTTCGVRNFITTHAYNYASSGVTDWLTDGEDWLDERLRAMATYGPTERLVLCGSGALMAINRLAKARGDFPLETVEAAYGVSVVRYALPFMTLFLKSHPLMTQEPTLEYTMMVLSTENLRNRYLRDTKYLDNREANDVDGKIGEYLTEGGLELHHEETFGYIDNLGNDDSLP